MRYLFILALAWVFVAPLGAQDDDPPMLTLDIALYVVEDADGVWSSQRTEDELVEILERVNAIWEQANIRFRLATVDTITVPTDILEAMAIGLEMRPFYEGAGVSFSVPDPATINGFYVNTLSENVNGINPFGSKLFFVRDDPSVWDERVTAHEIGHILGLHHTLEEPDRLLFPGTNGILLNSEERLVSRYFAQGILNNVR